MVACFQRQLSMLSSIKFLLHGRVGWRVLILGQGCKVTNPVCVCVGVLDSDPGPDLDATLPVDKGCGPLTSTETNAQSRRVHSAPRCVIAPVHCSWYTTTTITCSVSICGIAVVLLFTVCMRVSVVWYAQWDHNCAACHIWWCNRAIFSCMRYPTTGLRVQRITYPR